MTRKHAALIGFLIGVIIGLTRLAGNSGIDGGAPVTLLAMSAMALIAASIAAMWSAR